MIHPARNSIPALFDDSTSTLKHDAVWGASPGMYPNLVIFMLLNCLFAALTMPFGEQVRGCTQI